MAVLKEFRIFLELQKLEEEEFFLEKQLKKLPEYQELKVLRKEIEELQDDARQLRDEVLQEQWNLKRQENEIEALKTKLEETSTELYSGEITNVKELEAVEKQTVKIREAINSAEDRLLGLMGALEERKAGIKKISARINQMKNRFLALNENYKRKRDEMAGRLERVKKEKDLLMKQIPTELFTGYQELSKNYPDGKGAALLKKGVCSGCNMGVSFEILKQSKQNEDDLRCNNCGRILIVE